MGINRQYFVGMKRGAEVKESPAWHTQCVQCSVQQQHHIENTTLYYISMCSISLVK